MMAIADEWPGVSGLVEALFDPIQESAAPPFLTVSGLVKILLSVNPDAEKVRTWIIRNHKLCKDGFPQLPPAEPHEHQLLSLAIRCIFVPMLSPWEKASTEEREKHLSAVSRRAHELATLMEQPIAPVYPPAFYFFGDKAFDLLVANLDKSKISDVGVSVTDRMWSHVAAYSVFDGTEVLQPVPSMLRTLAAHVEGLRLKPRDTRPNTGNADVRVFARLLARYFDELYHRKPDAVIASLITLRFPDADPPSEDQVRRWRRDT